MENLLKIDACRNIGKDYIIAAVATGGHATAMEAVGQSHPDQCFRSYLVRGIREGFQIGFDYHRVDIQPSATTNIPSVREKLEVVGGYLAEDCCHGRIARPFNPTSLQVIHSSRFGVIPKSTPGKWHLIVDLLFPRQGSVNDGVEEVISTLSYIGVWDTVSEIVRWGRGTQLAKIDPYRNVPIHPDDR